MSYLITTGAPLQCSFGIAPCPFTALFTTTVIANVPVGTMRDVSAINIVTFGMCQSLSNPIVVAATSAALGVLTPMPCTPILAGAWINRNATVLAKEAPVLTTEAKAICIYGGNISFMNSLATNVSIG